MEVKDINSKPHLCLTAIKKIKAGEELRYDYGDTKLPWRKVCFLQLLTIYYDIQQICSVSDKFYLSIVEWETSFPTQPGCKRFFQTCSFHFNFLFFIF